MFVIKDVYAGTFAARMFTYNQPHWTTIPNEAVPFSTRGRAEAWMKAMDLTSGAVQVVEVPKTSSFLD